MATNALGFDNFYTSTLSAGITASDTTIYLNALPTATEGYLVIEPDSSTAREIIYYTSKGANFVTCPSAAAGRGVGATTAVSHSSGVTAQMNAVAEHFEALQDGTGIANNAITTAKVVDDAITDAKLVYGKVRTRQGGSATNWSTTGTTSYDYSGTNTFIQCGSITVGSGTITVTFPTAFSQIPTVIVTPRGGAGLYSAGNWYIVSETTTNFVIQSGNANFTSASWIAIGV